MSRKRLVRSPEEIFEYINDYFNSGIKSPRNYALSKGLSPTTFYQWLVKYRKNVECDEQEVITAPIVKTAPSGFFDITQEVIDSTVPKNVIEDKKVPTIIKLTKNDVILEFDISILKQVLEVLK